MTFVLRSLAVSDPGLVRPNNEDVAFAGSRLVAVADGMGGAPAGEVASEIVISTLAPVEGSAPDGEPVTALREAIATANGRIRAVTEADQATEGMGTTVTAMLLAGRRLAVAHVGDSRGYLLRGGRLAQLTRDDTFVQALVDQGGLTPEEARRHPQRSLVTRVVQGGPLEPATIALIAQAGDRLLLCSDGLSDVVDDDAIAATLAGFPDREECARQLVKLAHQAGAPDNVTLVVADVTAE
ncbi:MULTISPECIES: PP2C family serine/threonine-protein phosphatase [unclassified Plantactinospora]|uniref:PP2C family protein-serine/threonine phosphatase n=1 Tax=unclassified Plantactinospora TaxID=2631981 RepID=UPI000D15C3CD|nr:MULTISPECIES: protein phosphatase 2C domain-containing protein [unclassified Plantactinospora]AVT31107.1 protein phosphatase [Plantactinospora sp. BC1]AVT39651.1 protein phosphatase [Plantactinospora sp. BB1]